MAAFNGTGTYVRSYNWQVDKINGVKIRADRMDTEMDGFALGLSTCVTHDGQSPATANLPMGGFKHTGVADGTTRDPYASGWREQLGRDFCWCGQYLYHRTNAIDNGLCSKHDGEFYRPPNQHGGQHDNRRRAGF